MSKKAFPAGAVIGLLGGAVAVFFMQGHKTLAKLFLRLGLHVRTDSQAMFTTFNAHIFKFSRIIFVQVPIPPFVLVLCSACTQRFDYKNCVLFLVLNCS